MMYCPVGAFPHGSHIILGGASAWRCPGVGRPYEFKREDAEGAPVPATLSDLPETAGLEEADPSLAKECAT
jgi:hypothetical protein